MTDESTIDLSSKNVLNSSNSCPPPRWSQHLALVGGSYAVLPRGTRIVVPYAKGPPSPLQADAKPEDQRYYDKKLDKFEEVDSKAKGSIKLHLHRSIASQIKSEKTAQEIWDSLAKTYGVPGPSMAYMELREAISIVIPDNADPTPAVNAMIAHFSRLEEMNFGVPKKVQCLILLARLPSTMDYIVQRSCHELKSCSPRFTPYVLRFVT